MKKDSAATGRKHSGLAYIASAVGDILLPRTCVVCGRRLLVNERHLCTFCISDIPLTYNWNTKYHDIADRFNAFLQEDIYGYEPYSYVANLFFYNRDNGYRHICHKLKYQGNIRIGKHFSGILGRHLASSPLFQDVDTVVPVPLYWTRKWSRGYNQSDIIGKEIASALGAAFRPDILKRCRNTSSQTTLDIGEKRENVHDAFCLTMKAVRQYPQSATAPDTPCLPGHPAILPRYNSGLSEALYDSQDNGSGTADITLHTGPNPDFPKHILIVDDVFTSGATAAACHSALRKVFPPSVRISVATLAAVDED